MAFSARKLLFTCSLVTLLSAAGPEAFANPQDGVVAAGAAAITQTGKKLDIHQSTNKVVIDWRNFDIGADEETEFHQPNKNAIALNRVNSNSPTSIEGKLTANGNVVIVNQNGVMFKQGAQVDVNGLVVSTSDITNENFMNGRLVFDKLGSANAKIINDGRITAKDAGLVGFVAPRVENNGVIVANLGRVHLASGDKATVDLYGDGLMEVEVSDGVQEQIVKNTGTIESNGGKIALTAAAGREIVHGLIQVEGTLKAQSVGVRNGEIIIGAAGSNAVKGNVSTNKGLKSGASKVDITGTLDASGKQAGQAGGKITVTGDEIVLKETARLDTSGHAGGGNIKIGGDYQGKGTTETSKKVFVEGGALITNDAIETGNGGRTILWSDGVTQFDGLITARGGSISGDGGFAEVSGHYALGFTGLVDLSASHGEFGSLLLDPTDITISNAANSNVTGTTTMTGTAATSNINVTTLLNQLNTSAVTISTTSGYAGNGDITIVNPLSWMNNMRHLTLTAARDININATITSQNGANHFAATAGRDINVNAAISAINSGSNTTLTAGRDIFFNANVSQGGVGGNIAATATRDLTVASGVTLSSSTGGSISLRAANGAIASNGILTLNGALNMGTGTLTLLSGVDASSARADLTLNNTNFLMQGASMAAPSITGFRDITINRDITSSGNIALTAFRNLTIGSGATVRTGSSGSLSLTAANNVAGALGILSMNGTVFAGSSTLTLFSGVNGSGNRADLDLNATNFLSGVSVGSTTISGFNDITLNRDLTTGTTTSITAARDLVLNGAMSTSGTGGITTSAGRDLIVNNTITATGTGGVVTNSGQDVFLNANISSANTIGATAGRNLTIGSGATISSGASAALALRAANNVSTGNGIFTNNGTIRIGTGVLTLVSGLDAFGRRADLTFDNSSLILQGASMVNPTLTGFRDINLNRNLTFSNATTITANRNLTIGAGATIASGATTLLTLRAANNSSTTEGIFTNNGTISIGSAALTLVSGVDGAGNRADLTFDNTSFLLQGPWIVSPTLTGFRDINLNRNISFSGAATITANRNLTIGSGATIASGATTALTLNAANGTATNAGIFTNSGAISIGSGTLAIVSGRDTSNNLADLTLDNTNFLMQGTWIANPTLTGFRDINLNRDITFTANASITANRNMTIGSGATITSGATTSLTLRAANNGVNGIGVFTNNGAISIGSGLLTIVSGYDGLGTAVTNRADLTFDNSSLIMQGSSMAAPTLTGFRDINLNRNITFSNAAVITANRNLTIGSGATIASAPTLGLTLNAAAASTSGTGIFTNNGTISVGTSNLTLSSGVDEFGDRADLILDNANLMMQGASMGTMTINGFRDITLNREITGSVVSLNTNRDVFLNNNITTSGNLVVNALRDINIVSGSTLTTGGHLYLTAANASTSGLGVLNMNGILNLTNSAGELRLVSGNNASGDAPDLVLDHSNLLISPSVTIATTRLNGFRDLTLNRDMTFGGALTSIVKRNLTIGSGTTISIGANAILQAANNVTTQAGIFTNNGTLIVGAGTLTIASGLDSFGNATDLTLDNTSLQTQAARFNGLTFTGFRDITINRDIEANTNIAITANRNLTIGSGATIRSASGSSTSLNAAGGSTTGVGHLVLNGTIDVGTGLTLTSGVDGDGDGADLVLNNSTMLMQGAAIGGVNITGFRDIVLDRDITSTTNMNIVATRNLTLNAGRYITPGSSGNLNLIAANSVNTGIGLLTINGTLNTGLTGNLTLRSGFDEFGNRNNLTIDDSTIHFGGSMGGLTVSGFNDVVFAQDVNSLANISVTAMRHLTVNNGVHVKNGSAYTMSLQAAGGSTTGTGLLTLNGKISMGRQLTLTSGLYNGDRSDLLLNSSSYEQLGTTISNGLEITGFRDIDIDTTMRTGSANLVVRAERNLTVGSSGLFETNNGFSTALRAAGGDINAIGLLTFNGVSNLTLNSRLSLVSGVDVNGNRADLTLDGSNYVRLGSAIGPVDLLGYRDVNINTDMISSQGINVVAHRNLTIGSGVNVRTGTTFGTILQAAGGVTTATGIFTNNGTIYTGTGGLILTSGVNGLGHHTDLVFDDAHFQAIGSTIGDTTITGFRDITLAKDYNSSSSVSIIAMRNLTLNAGHTITTASTSGLRLQAANGVTTGAGILSLNGTLNTGTGLLTLTSGVDGSGNCADLTLNSTNFLTQGATVGAVSLTGFRDIILDRDITSSGSVSVQASRHITLNAGKTLATGTSGGLSLSAAGNDRSQIGLLALNGNVSVGSGEINLVSGTDASGNRRDLALNGTNFILNGASQGEVTISGFRDILLDRDLVSRGAVTINANRNLTIGSNVLVKSGSPNSIQLYAAGGDRNAVGVLVNNGRLEVGRFNLRLLSGLDSFGNRTDLVLDGSNFSMQQGFIRSFLIDGFRDITLNTDITADYTNPGINSIYAARDLTIGPNANIFSNVEATLIAGRSFINNSGADAVTVGSGARYLIYAQNPSATTLGSLPYDFVQFNCTYGGACGTLGSGNGLLYAGADQNAPPSGSGPVVIPGHFNGVPDTVNYVSSVGMDNKIDNNVHIVRGFNPFQALNNEIPLTIDNSLAEQLGLESGIYEIEDSLSGERAELENQ